MANKLKKLGLPDSFCFAPYTNLDLDQAGGILPCYRSKDFMGEWKKTPKLIVDEFNNDNMRELRDTLWNGKEHSNCKQCHAREAKGITSARQDINKHFLENLVEPDKLDYMVSGIKKDHTFSPIANIHSMEIRPHGVCNLACAHCNQESSTNWITLLRTADSDVFESLKEPMYIDGDTTQSQLEIKHVSNFISDQSALHGFYERADNIKTIHFTGGEPLLDKRHLDWLDSISNKGDIELKYHTNLQHQLYDKFFDIWNKFKSVKVFASIDTSEKYYSYFRYGADWDVMHRNIKAIQRSVPNCTIKATITVNLLTMLDWTGIVQYIVDNELDMHVAFVDPPHPISTAYLPADLINKALVDLSKSLVIIKDYQHKRKATLAVKQVERVVEFLTSITVYPSLPKKTHDYIKSLDKIYKLRLSKLSPELSEYL